MSIPVPRAPKTRFTAPARAVPAPEEVSAGGLIIDFDRPEQLPVAIIARINRNGQREWCLPKGHIEHGETTVEAAQREISEETGITGYPVASSAPSPTGSPPTARASTKPCTTTSSQQPAAN